MGHVGSGARSHTDSDPGPGYIHIARSSRIKLADMRPVDVMKGELPTV